eukprot:9459422-Prorocentrum_lima.AAC.1
MLIADAYRLNPKLTPSAVVQLAKSAPGEKDRLSILALSYYGKNTWYPWLVRANHGHGVPLNWPRMFSRLWLEMLPDLGDICHQTECKHIGPIMLD